MNGPRKVSDQEPTRDDNRSALEAIFKDSNQIVVAASHVSCMRDLAFIQDMNKGLLLILCLQHPMAYG